MPDAVVVPERPTTRTPTIGTLNPAHALGFIPASRLHLGQGFPERLAGTSALLETPLFGANPGAF